MPSIRIYELAKEFKISTKELINYLNKIGIENKKAMSGLNEEECKYIRKNFLNKEIKKDTKIINKQENIKNNNKIDKNSNKLNKNNNKIDSKKQFENIKNKNNIKTENNTNNKNVTKTENNIKNKNNVKTENEIKQNNKKTLSKKDKRKLEKEKENEKLEKEKLEEKENDIKIIKIGKSITVKELSEKLNKNTSEIIKFLIKIGIMATINQEIDFYTASNIAEKFNVFAEEVNEIDLLEEIFKEDKDNEEDKIERPPVVVVMGHVDHGKTSLLDTIRSSKVTDKEAGGITQHIGAYTVSINNKYITFLDTPGHEAFTAMRMRGAQVTDIAILVVAADDGVMPQTIEAINHARAANLEIIVAINKIDKQSADIEKVKKELSDHGILTEDWGGDIVCVPVSAKNKIGIDNLLEMILIVAELKDLKVNPNKKARGTVIESKIDKGRGVVATVLVQSGTLNIGDPVVAGTSYGKVRAMIDDKGNKVKKAGPSMPIEILGFCEAPISGDMFYVASSDKQARQVAQSIVAKNRIDLIKTSSQKVSVDDLFNQIKDSNIKELNIIIKADVQGSLEALKNSLERLSNDEVIIKIIHCAVGLISESDVMLASTSKAIIIGFNVKIDSIAKNIADEEKVDFKIYNVIYNAIEDINIRIKGLLSPIFEEKILGHAEIRQLFKASGVGTIAGSYILDGKFTRNSKARVLRNKKVIYDGEIAALKRFKDDVKEVNEGYECGILLNKFNDIEEGDIVESYIMEEIPR